ncbi:hypothetical protein M2171_005566 [Bradyrhizobium japonicum USDA 38]|uniref:hypothetical protein n=1 Tax=Bradyrhizobium japonicum TaxID=375 RepID=UPI000482FBCE|nr:hypothetical protein [Bradyrhizobium japonicum]MCS3896433.1 hypothetical protein [Bradyrhizobium japonicum USDA 38]MCS3948948.1 hypothetical protein [Bradyrhizobium japonicum]
MNLRSIANRITNADLSYVLGRFKTVRTAYSGARKLAALGSPTIADARDTPTLFPGADVSQIVQAIREEAVFIGLQLPPSVVGEIEAFAKSEPLHAIYDPKGPTFKYSDVVRGKCIDGRTMPIGGITDPARCPAVQRVINDPALRAIVRQYLGHEPRRIMTILDWSFASDISDEQRRKLRHHVIDYHYDVMGYNFVYASFYITATDRYSGAHVMMKRSHNRKPLRMLIGSVRASEADVRRQYGIENEVVIEGQAGLGFVQDTSCYHRASPPTQGDRLMLAVRFIN